MLITGGIDPNSGLRHISTVFQSGCLFSSWSRFPRRELTKLASAAPLKIQLSNERRLLARVFSIAVSPLRVLRVSQKYNSMTKINLDPAPESNRVEAWLLTTLLYFAPHGASQDSRASRRYCLCHRLFSLLSAHSVNKGYFGAKNEISTDSDV